MLFGGVTGGLWVANANDWFAWDKITKRRTCTRIWLMFSEDEKANLENFYNNIISNSKVNKPLDKDPLKDVGTRYEITSGDYKKYNLLTRNCTDMVIDALLQAIPTQLKSACLDAYDDKYYYKKVYKPNQVKKIADALTAYCIED